MLYIHFIFTWNLASKEKFGNHMIKYSSERTPYQVNNIKKEHANLKSQQYNRTLLELFP